MGGAGIDRSAGQPVDDRRWDVARTSTVKNPATPGHHVSDLPTLIAPCWRAHEMVKLALTPLVSPVVAALSV